MGQIDATLRWEQPKVEIDGLDDDEDHGPTFEANFFFSKKTPEGARKCKVMFCFVSMFCFFFLCVGVFFGIRYLCLVVMHPCGLLVFPLFLSLGTATGTGDHS